MLCRDVGRRASTRPCRVSLLKQDIAYSAYAAYMRRNAHFCHVIVIYVTLVLPPAPVVYIASLRDARLEPGLRFQNSKTRKNERAALIAPNLLWDGGELHRN